MLLSGEVDCAGALRLNDEPFVVYRKSKLLDEIAEEKLSVEEQAQRDAQRAALQVVNAERVSYRQEEYEVKDGLRCLHLEFCGLKGTFH